MQPSLFQQHANYRTNPTTILLKTINTKIIIRNSYRIRATIIQNNNAHAIYSINGIIFGNSTLNTINSSNINISYEYQRLYTTMLSIISLNTNNSRKQNSNDDTQSSEATLSKNKLQQKPHADATIETMLANSSNGSSSSATMTAAATTTLFAAAAGACTFQTVDGHGCISSNGPNTSNTSTNSSTALEHYRLQLYNYALNIERLRCPQYSAATAMAVAATYASNNTNTSNCSTGSISAYPSVGSYMPGTGRHFALSMSSLVFPQRLFQPDEPKPQHSYIGLIAMAILSSTETKLVLSDIYQYILDNYPYFRARGPGWRNSIRHNLSLNDCFIKSGRSANGKGHYWAIHPANMDDFRKGDFRRRKAQRKVRKHMGLSVDDAGTDSPSPPPPLSITPPPTPTSLSLALAAVHHPHHHQQLAAAHRHLTTFGYLQQPIVSPFHQQHQQQNYLGQPFASSTAIGVTVPHYVTHAEQNQSHPANVNNNHLQQQQQHNHHPVVPHQLAIINETTTTRTHTASVIANLYSQTRKRQFDVASLLAPDVKLVDIVDDNAITTTVEDDEANCDDTGSGGITTTQHTVITKVSVQHQHHHQHHKQQVAYQLEPKQHLGEILEDQEDIDVCVSDEGEQHDQGQYHKSAYDETDDNNSLLSIPRSRRSSLDAGNSSRRQSPHSSDTTTTTTTVERLNIQQHLTPLQQDAIDEGAKATAIELSNINMNPHIFGRYYGSYMAAARRMHAASVALESPSLSQQHQYQEQHQSLPP